MRGHVDINHAQATPVCVLLAQVLSPTRTCHQYVQYDRVLRVLCMHVQTCTDLGSCDDFAAPHQTRQIERFAAGLGTGRGQ